MTEIQKTFENIHGGTVTTTSRLFGLLFAYARGAKRIAELGVANPCTTYALLHALEKSGGGRLVSVDIQNAYPEAVRKVEDLARDAGIDFAYIEADSATIDLGEVDFLFIDSLHERGHLLRELNRHAGQVTTAIAFHDTEYPCNLLPVVREWLGTEAGREWEIFAHYEFSHGFTVITRRSTV